MNLILFCGYTDTKSRVAALANTALLMARADRKVVISTTSANAFDLDLLISEEDERTTRQYRSVTGLTDLTADYKESLLSMALAEVDGSERDEDDYIEYGTLRIRRPSKYLMPIPLQSEDADVLLLRGGPRKFSNSEPLQDAEPALDWEDFWSNWAGDAFFDHLVRDVAGTAELLLLDCDLSTHRGAALLLAQQANAVVLLTDYSEGATADAYHFASDLKDKFTDAHAPAILPVPSAVHINDEIEILEKCRDHFQRYLSSKYAPGWLTPYWFVQAEIPYVPYYAHRNLLLARQPISRIHVPLYQAYQYLAANIVESVEKTGGLRQRPQQNLSERFLDARRRARWDVFISYSSADTAAASTLRETFRAHQLRAFLSNEDLTVEIGTKKWLDAINHVLERSAILVILASQSALESKWVQHEFVEFRKHDRLVVPVRLGASSIPEEMTQYQVASWDGRAESQEELRRILSLVLGGAT